LNNVLNDIEVRVVRNEDVVRLASFFKKSYGESTIFQDEEFIKYYFRIGLPECHSVLAERTEGEIISFYGSIAVQLKITGKLYKMDWGINAFTLPEWRGKGLNQQILKLTSSFADIHGVIGFTPKTAEFYVSKGYNLFDKRRFARSILILDLEKSLAISKEINGNVDHPIFSKSYMSNSISIKYNSNAIIKLNADSLESHNLDLASDLNQATINRSKDWLNWRFLKNPTINYKSYAYVADCSIKGIIIWRTETLQPSGYLVNRIVDLWGDGNSITHLLTHSIQESTTQMAVYLDFTVFGKTFEHELENLGFILLENEDCRILPQVSAPVQDRPNNEYLGLRTTKHDELIDSLTTDDVYFTRADSDRDRLARIDQLSA
jgi:Acetyltransferase (GNAT) domain